MNISQMRKLTVLGGRNATVEQRLKTLSEALGLELVAAQGVLRAVVDAVENPDDNVVDELAEYVYELRQRQERCAQVIRDIKARCEARKAAAP